MMASHVRHSTCVQVLCTALIYKRQYREADHHVQDVFDKRRWLTKLVLVFIVIISSDFTVGTSNVVAKVIVVVVVVITIVMIVVTGAAVAVIVTLVFVVRL